MLGLHLRRFGLGIGAAAEEGFQNYQSAATHLPKSACLKTRFGTHGRIRPLVSNYRTSKGVKGKPVGLARAGVCARMPVHRSSSALALSLGSRSSRRGSQYKISLLLPRARDRVRGGGRAVRASRCSCFPFERGDRGGCRGASRSGSI
jgi:hypothetical protein